MRPYYIKKDGKLVLPERKPGKYSKSYDEPSLTQQNEAASADINAIMKKYQETGQLPDLIKIEPIYGEFADLPTYQESMNIILHAQDQFNNLSATARKRFGNDPKNFLAFCNDEKNLPEMIKLGLAEEVLPEEPVLVNVVNQDSTENTTPEPTE